MEKFTDEFLGVTVTSRIPEIMKARKIEAMDMVYSAKLAPTQAYRAAGGDINFRIGTLVKLAFALGVEIGDLFLVETTERDA